MLSAAPGKENMYTWNQFPPLEERWDLRFWKAIES